MKLWPKLSEQLAGERRPDRCQKCGVHWAEIERWREHDDHDEPTDVVIVLCRECAEAVIEKHPRLYSQVPRNAPLPGCMDLCTNCELRSGLQCTHPDLKANGGPGLAIICSKPSVAFVDGTDKSGRRRGWREVWYERPPRECAGRRGTEVLKGADCE